MLEFNFWTIVTSILFIACAYIIFMRQIEPRTKIIMIVLLFILGIVLFMNLNLFKNYNGLVTDTSPATKTIRVPRESINKNSGNYSLSTWIYIDDWNYKFGQKKTVLKRENSEKKPNPHIYLDPYKNDISVEFYVKDASENDMSNNYVEAEKWCRENTSDVSVELLECNFNPDTGEYVASNSGVKCVNNMYECLDGTPVNMDENNSCNELNNDQKSTLKNIPLQKWFHILYGFGDNHTDIYLNGKLVQTKTFKGVQFMNEFENNDFFICSDGGYSGSISKTSYYNYLVSPNKAYQIYKEGFNNVMVGSLFSKYNASVTFYEDNNERAKYYIV